MPLTLISLLAVSQCPITNYLITNSDYYQSGPYSWESNDFRAIRLGDAVAGLDSLGTNMIATLMVEHDYDLVGLKGIRYNNRLLATVEPANYRELRHAYETILGDSEYFPIPKSRDKDMPEVVFEDGWVDGWGYVSGGGDGDGRGDGRAENGQEDGGQADNDQENSGRQNSPRRRHEGCDIMGAEMPPGYYLVVSMTDGAIEKIGRPEMGGWRIDIWVPGGAYLYYAHPYDYAGDLEEEDRAKAGELTGYIGDTGYGKTEGTRGNFDVHFRAGVYIKTDHDEEMSMNPYWILKWLEKRRLVSTH